MKPYIEKRAVEVATYIVSSNCTVRQAAKKFGYSKSGVHKDMTERLPDVNKDLADSVRTVLNTNKADRARRGGVALKVKRDKK